MTHNDDLEDRESFIARLKGANLDKHEIDMIMCAYRLAKSAHRTIQRDDGTRYFEHARAGCLILMDELGIYNPELLISFLLHDVGEDTGLLGYILESYNEFLSDASFLLVNLFGIRVYITVMYLTKPAVDNHMFFNAQDAYDYYIQNLKKSEDAILLKMVDRLHNLRSLQLDNIAKIARQVKETREVYLPIFESINGELKPSAEILIRKIKSMLMILESRLQKQ